jgi:glycosyltransferase involved in cell wall biosynthesis
MAGQISCDSLEIEQVIESYGVSRQRIASIPCFSLELLEFPTVPLLLPPQFETFLSTHFPVFSCYVSYRPEYRLPVLREAMVRFRQVYPNAGFVWVGFPAKEFLSAQASLGEWPKDEAQSLLLLGNLPHAEFLSLQRRCSACIRTPACDGVSASVLEALALGIPVVASENGRRPPGVVIYLEHDAADLCAKLVFVMEHYESVKAQTRVETLRNNTKDMVDWLLDGPANTTPKRPVHVS